VDAVGVAEELLGLPSDEAEVLAAKYIDLWGFKNTYAMGKHLAEKAVVGLQREHGLPLVIVRPALVSGVAGEPYPGYSGNFAGQVGGRGGGAWRGWQGAALGRGAARAAALPPGLAPARAAQFGSGPARLALPPLTRRRRAPPQVGGAVAYMVGLYNDQPEAVASDGNSIWDVVPGAWAAAGPGAVAGGGGRGRGALAPP
jgi:hypothetical protein